MARRTAAEARQLVTAAGFEVAYYSDRSSETCVGCRRRTCTAIRGGSPFCSDHVQRAIEVAEFYRDRDEQMAR